VTAPAWHAWLRPLASLRLTVVLLSLALVLIFVGTIAQTRLGVWQAVDLYFRSPLVWIDLSLFRPGLPEAGAGSLPFPGGSLIAALMIVNLLAAHAVRFKMTRKRLGVVGLHAGLIVLLVGEFVTGMMADEGLMRIDEGGAASFIEDIRSVELALVDHGDATNDRVVTVPGRMLASTARQGQIVSDPALPVRVRVTQWMDNARLMTGSVADAAASDLRGLAREAHARQIPRVRGVDGGQADAPATLVTLESSHGEVLGTWLISAAYDQPQAVEIDGRPCSISLRYARTYTPFTLHLIDFRHDTFVGTGIARNFSSDIRLVDPERQTDRQVRIWMNNPLRYRGRAFYQASYKPDGSGTVLQVVDNPGWLLPYIASAMVGLAMTIHFLQGLMGFLRRRRNASDRDDAAQGTAASPSIRRPGRWTAPVAGLLGLFLACSALLRPVPGSDLELRDFGLLPASADGRVKPMDTVARNLLMSLGGRQSVRTESREVSAVEYLVDLMARPDRVRDLPVIRIDHPDVLALLGLAIEDSGRQPLAVIEPAWPEITRQAQQAASVPPRERDGFQRAVLDLHQRVNTLLAHAQLLTPHTVPPLQPGEDWRTFRDAFMDGNPQQPHPAVAYWAAMMSAASESDAARFAESSSSFRDVVDRSMPDAVRRARLEVWFNRASLFTGSTAVYLLAALAACASFLLRLRTGSHGHAERARVASLSLLIAAVIVHTAALALRVYLQDRPPVTNLYSSAVFVGWAAAAVGVLLEKWHPLGVASLGASVVGFCTLIVAHNLGNDGDTMQMMQAVLDSNFWLATHVVTITLGYSATFLAGFLGAALLLADLFTGGLSRSREQSLSKMVYAMVCFALLLSFVGTVLGGIWADQSWGRFWGWDPKENGAALVVLINAITLHARWGGMVRARGIAVLAVAGNIVTAWSWFGTNMLGVGLHAYGFMDSAAAWLIGFVASQAALMILGVTLARKSSTKERASRNAV
jgi:ABC-type transport system involved in cytochrome c biogenesis permease subunit